MITTINPQDFSEFTIGSVFSKAVKIPATATPSQMNAFRNSIRDIEICPNEDIAMAFLAAFDVEIAQDKAETEIDPNAE